MDASDAPDATPDAAPPKAGLETTTCSRCGGSGNYSYCQRYGTTCFQCGGRKVVLTKRGSAAAAYLERLRSKPAADVAVGDVIRETSITVGGEPYDFWARVTERTADGWAYEAVRGKEKGTTQTAPDTMVRVAQTAAQKRETLAQALAYQATLKADGKPYKRAPTASKRPTLSDDEKAARKAARREAKAQEIQARIAAAREVLGRDDVRAALAAQPHPQPWGRDKGLTLLDWAAWMMANAGTSGRLAAAKAVEAVNTPPAPTVR